MRQLRLPSSPRSEVDYVMVDGDCDTSERETSDRCAEVADLQGDEIGATSAQRRDQVARDKLPLLDRWARSLVFRRLGSLNSGSLSVVEDGDSPLAALEPPPTFGQTSSCRATLKVHRARFYRRVVLGGEIGFAESLIDGDCSSEQLTDLVRLFIRNSTVAAKVDGGVARLFLLLNRLKHAWRRNTRTGSRRNIHEHYDLGNDFYSLFLDQTMSYSSGIFDTPDATMYEASLAKLARVCDKLALRPEDHLLEIGTGWGGLAIYAAQQYGCRVTTTTISEEQYKLARERVERNGLSDRITVLKRDYRDLTGQFDKLVSIEMIEAVGHEFLPEFFRLCSQRLKPNGMMLIQGIVILDQQYERYRHDIDFIRTHIFPGGCLPSTQTLVNASANATDLRMLHLEDIGQHYVTTLRRWREKFWAEINGVRQLGHSERFIRMWDYYLAYCEASFAERQVNNVQILWAKPECRFDPVAIELRPCTVS